MTLAQYERFLPGHPDFKALVDWVRNYLGIEYAWDFELVLRREEVPARDWAAEPAWAGPVGCSMALQPLTQMTSVWTRKAGCKPVANPLERTRPCLRTHDAASLFHFPEILF